MVLKTKLTEALGIEHPVIQGGMHYVGYAVLAAAVSNAGGLGIITALTVYQGPNAKANLRHEIQMCKALTDRPFGVNITLLPMLSNVDMPGLVQIVIEEGVKIVETAGNKPDAVIAGLKKAGIFVIHKCTTIRHAKKAEKLGVDMISMDGFDCGGHPGEDDVGNWVLIPMAAKALKIPFVVSGGTSNGAQLAASLALGAVGINMGTRFMATVEAPLHPRIKQALVEADAKDTTHVYRSLNNTERVFKNYAAKQVQALEEEHPGDFTKIQHLVRGEYYRRSFQETGDVQNSIWSCGTSIGLIDNIPTCQDLMKEIISDAESVITNRLKGLVQSNL